MMGFNCECHCELTFYTYLVGDATILEPVTEDGIICRFQFPYYGKTAGVLT